ncbi:MAG: response regulator [Candidatus Omnitrophota bacterium]|nr:response regulator [Candidatus Omnitrophota bacterium]
MAKKILAVDDEIEVLEIIKRKLEEKGYIAFTASSAKECLEIAEKEIPDLILLDIVMPDMNGYQVCAALKDNPKTKNINILFTTGQDLEPKSIIKRCEELGAFDFLLKPFTMEDLLKKVAEILKIRG